MPIPSLAVIASAAAGAGLVSALSFLAWRKRVKDLERELRGVAEAICQLADSQMGLQRKVSGAMGEMEEKILDLAVPSRDAGRNLDRRHRVLSLARRGLAVEEIARQLKVPKGEAELIVSLRKYMEKGAAQPVPAAAREP